MNWRENQGLSLLEKSPLTAWLGIFILPCVTNFQIRRQIMKIEFHIDYFEEDGVIVALSPELQVSSFGDTLVEAEKSIKEALELFIEGCETLGTLNDVLEESGFHTHQN